MLFKRIIRVYLIIGKTFSSWLLPIFTGLFHFLTWFCIDFLPQMKPNLRPLGDHKSICFKSNWQIEKVIWIWYTQRLRAFSESRNRYFSFFGVPESIFFSMTISCWFLIDFCSQNELQSDPCRYTEVCTLGPWSPPGTTRAPLGSGQSPFLWFVTVLSAI